MLPIHPFLLILPFLFYANHLWIFGLVKMFHVDLSDEDNPNSKVIERSKGILYMVNIWSRKRFGFHYSKPICLCAPCMSSLHSTYIYWSVAAIVGIESWMMPLYILYVGCLTGYNHLKG